MKIYCTFFAILLLITSSFAQSEDNLNTPTLISSNTGSLFTFDRSDKTIQGSPYINPVFVPVRVIADTEQIFNARYNAVSDEIEVETDKNSIQAINKHLSDIKVVFLNTNKTYKGMTYFDEEGNSIRGFLSPLNNDESNIRLFLKEKIVFVDRKPAKSSYQVAKPAKFDRLNDVFYITIGSEIAKPLSNNKKEIASLFPDFEKDILKYISSEKLNLKKQEDIIILVEYINKRSQ